MIINSKVELVSLLDSDITDKDDNGFDKDLAIRLYETKNGRRIN